MAKHPKPEEILCQLTSAERLMATAAGPACTREGCERGHRPIDGRSQLRESVFGGVTRSLLAT